MMQSRSHVSTFVHGLYLLDLDQREDWPEVSVGVFEANASLQHRIRCVEWSLYRLFELYEPKATRDKLRPFFPPATSLQSVNLRAALLRQLTELKKNGVLGASALLRKTMLDECKGDKFEEVLAAFSIVVLKQCAVKDRRFERIDPAHMIPILLAYQKTIQSGLEKRRRLEEGVNQQHKHLDAAVKAAIEQEARLKRQKPIHTPRNAATLQDLVRQSWIGQDAWVETILHGVPLTAKSSSDTADRAPPDSRLVEDLQIRLKEQNTRLQEWQSYLLKLKARQSFIAPTQAQGISSQAQSTRFGAHKDLNLSSRSLEAEDPPLKPAHKLLLDALQAELVPRVQPAATILGSRDTTPTKAPSQTPKHAPRPTPTRAESLVSGISSQDTIVAEPEDEMTPVKSVGRWKNYSPTADDTPKPRWSLQDRARMSMAGHQKPASFAAAQKGFQSFKLLDENDHVSAITNQPYDKDSLAQRTRQSMSMLKNVLDDAFEARQPQQRPRKPSHNRSQTTLHVPSQVTHRRRLERAWSEESLASTATKEEVDLEADYASVFKSRPRLAMSPNLSPQQSNNDLWLDRQLQEGMNQLSIDSSPEY